MATIVIMPGGFHPFHAGHYALYRSAVEAFPDADVYVAATADTSTRPFPFPVKEKLAKLAGVPANRFVQVKSPFKAEEITTRYNPLQDTLIFVRSDKDQNTQPKPGSVKKDGSPGYLQPYTGDVEPFAKHAYMAYLPTIDFSDQLPPWALKDYGPGWSSATKIRGVWPQLDDTRKTELVMSLYPRTQSNPKLAATVRKMLDTAIVGDTLSESAGQVDFKKNLLSILQQKYPDAKFKLRSDGVESADGQLTVIADTAEEGRYVGCFMWDVSTGPYKGALAQAIQQTTNQLLQSNPGKKPALFVSGDNQNPEAWSHIAKKLKYKLITDEDELEENQGWAATYEEVRAAPSGVGAGMTAGYQRRENQPIAEKRRPEIERDPELKQARLFAKQHYPEFSGDEDLAYDKWVQRSIKHGLEADQKQYQILQGIAEKIKRLENAIAAVKQQRQQANEDYLDEKWSEKYKRSINCSNPRGFSQRAHCAGRKK